MNAQTKLQRAKIALLLDQPFFGALLLGLRTEKQSSDSVRLMATDGQRLLWNTQGLDKLTERETVTVLAHEALHCALLHPLRRGERDMRDWNTACDHAVNLVLEQCNTEARRTGKAEPFPWPKLDGIPKNPQYAGKSAEEIYYHTDTDTEQQPGGQGDEQGDEQGDDGGLGDVLDAPGDEADKQTLEAQWKVNLVQAAQAARGQGKLPAAMSRLVADMINPPARWQDLLRTFVRENCKDDYSWTRPNPRYASTGFILPSLHSQRLGRIAVAIDTSGSINESLLNSFLGELETLMHECRPAGVTLIDCDAQVNSVRELEVSDSLPRDFRGGGGTDFRPVFDLLVNDPPSVLVYFTDLEGDFPDTEPGYPVLWGVYNTSCAAPFGQTIKLDSAR